MALAAPRFCTLQGRHGVCASSFFNSIFHPYFFPFFFFSYSLCFLFAFPSIFSGALSFFPLPLLWQRPVPKGALPHTTGGFRSYVHTSAHTSAHMSVPPAKFGGNSGCRRNSDFSHANLRDKTSMQDCGIYTVDNMMPNHYGEFHLRHASTLANIIKI